MPADSARTFKSMVDGLATVLSPGEICRETHLSRATVWRARIGDAKLPSHETFVRVERAWERAGKPVAK